MIDLPVRNEPILRTESRRAGRRVALLAKYPERDPAMPQFISNHGLRMVEAALRAEEFLDLDLRVYDLNHAEVQPLVDHLIEFDPDVVGFSAFLWSFPFFVQVAHHLKRDDPRRLIVFGGPSARPSMMQLDPFRPASQFIDVLVMNEGEITFREIVRQRAAGDTSIIGTMLESNLVAGNQSFPQPLDQLVRGQSITDKCIDWDTTDRILHEAAELL